MVKGGLAWDADDRDHLAAALVVDDLYHLDEEFLGPSNMLGVLCTALTNGQPSCAADGGTHYPDPICTSDG
jgi:hypothetical protein